MLKKMRYGMKKFKYFCAKSVILTQKQRKEGFTIFQKINSIEENSLDFNLIIINKSMYIMYNILYMS